MVSRAWHLTPEEKAKKSHRLDAFDVALDDSFLTDRSTRLVAVAGAERGSLVFFEFEAIETPYTLDHVEWFVEVGPITLARFVLELPPGWSVRSAWLRHPGVEPQPVGAARVWELRELPAPVEEELSWEPDDRAPILALAFSPPDGASIAPAVLPDWASLARWFERLAEGRDRVTPEVAALADGAVAAGGDLLGRLRSSTLRVRDSVRYVAKVIGVGGYQPRPASETVATRYGDCKDKATLFRSILSSRGILSYPVLVNLGERDTVPEAVATPQAFNHLVVAVPVPAGEVVPPDLSAALADGGELGRLLFVDTTDEYSSFGSISSALAGQRGLVVAGVRGRLFTLPGTDPAAHRVERRLRDEILPDRSLRVRVESRYYGRPAASARADYRRSSQDRREAEESRLRTIWPGARVNEYAVVYESPGGEFIETATADLPRLAPSGPQAWVHLFPGSREELPTVPLGRRRAPVVYEYPRTLRMESIWLGVPAETELPDPRVHEGEGGSVSTHYERGEAGVRGLWELRLTRTTFNPDAFEEIRRLWSAAASAGGAVLDLSSRRVASKNPSRARTPRARFPSTSAAGASRPPGGLAIWPLAPPVIEIEGVPEARATRPAGGREAIDMCGIAGVVGRPGQDPERSVVVARMTAALAHRGPDGEGHARRAGCDLGFRRLAIVDVGGPAPPFSSEDGHVWTICNGEIYNYPELRARLQARGHRLRTRVDTELLPHLYEEHGSGLAAHLDGMFAFAVWDERRQILLLGRDRAGEKPLFYWSDEEELVFASEMRALLAHPRVPRALDPVALSRYLLHDYFPAPLTPLAGVRKLPAGHVLVARRGAPPAARRYWDLAVRFARAQRVRDLDGAAAELDARVAQAVRRRKRSDVPVGVFLSGGIDSSCVLAHLAEQEGPGVPVFTLGHADTAFDESRFARDTARHFGAEFNALILGERDLEEGLRRVGEGFDEPLGDASTIPTHLLALHARRKVKVVLSGEGGDELLAGYPTYPGHRIAEVFRRIPRPLRDGALGLARRLTPTTMGNVGLDYLLARFADALARERLERHHVWFGSLAPERQRQVLAPPILEALAGDDPFDSARAVLAGRRFPDPLAELLYTDFCMYLQDDLLTKVDRATMLASLEARAPFLDPALVEYVAGLPSDLKLRGLTTKAVLRRALRRRLPAAVLRRRKRGFNIPFSRWLLRGLGERLRERFSEERVRARGLLDPAGVSALLEEHLSRRADHRKPIFSLLALDLWCDRTYGTGAAVPVAAKAADIAVPARIAG